MGDLIPTILLVAAVLGVVAVVISAVLKRLLYICSPNEVLVFSGTIRKVGKKMIGYKIIKGGRAIRVPLFEVVDRMDLTNMPIDLEVKGAYSKGGIPLNVVGIANVKIAGHQPILDNAIERFLGKSRNELMLIAKDTLEGTLRGVLATLTPEEVNEDKIKFAQALLEEATDDLSRLGLTMDTLKIQDVSDEVKYLDSIGRKRSAEIQRKARIAEAEARAAALVREAMNERETELKRIEADVETVRAQNRRRIADAVTRGEAMVAESRGQVAAELARANAEVSVQSARIERERRRLSADVLEPARAQKAAKEANARADAAEIIEQGRANAEAMRRLSATWQTAGTNARDVFLVQKLDKVMRHVLSTMGNLQIDRMTMLGMGDGGSSEASGLARKLIRGNEEIRSALGVDLVRAMADRFGDSSDRPAKGANTSSKHPSAAPQEPGSAAPPPKPASASATIPIRNPHAPAEARREIENLESLHVEIESVPPPRSLASQPLPTHPPKQKRKHS